MAGCAAAGLLLTGCDRKADVAKQPARLVQIETVKRSGGNRSR
jgi:hypothetical protein